MSAGAASVATFMAGAGRPSVVLPSPSSPWMKVAGRNAGATPTGPAAPRATGMSARPAAASTRPTLVIAVSSATFPQTTVTASTSSSGERSAHHSAAASSTPPSVSMITARGMGPPFDRDLGKGLAECRN